MAIIVGTIITIFDTFNTPWDWIASIAVILVWAVWFLFMLMVGPAIENAFPPTFNVTNTNDNPIPKLLPTNSERINKTNT